jgi:O-antigen/teichoic acid export membrane protein
MVLKNLLSGMRREFLLYSSSTLLMQGSKLLTSLIIARLLGPEIFGWWNTLQPLLIYAAMLHFGVLNGMNRDVPYFNGRGDLDRAEYIRRVSWGITIISALFASLLTLAASFFFPTNPLLENSLRFLAILLLFQQWYLYKSMLLVSAIRFPLLSVQQIAQGVLFPIFCLIMAKYWGLNGFILAQALVNLIVCLLMTGLTHYDLRPIINWAESIRLAKIGFPIMMAGFLYDTLRALDRWVILSFLGAVQVGYYTLTILVLQAITLLPSVVTSQFYPRISKRFGETHSYLALQPLLFTTLKASSALILPFGLVVFLLVRPLTQLFLPAYMEGIDAALIVSIGVTLSRPIAGTAISFLNAVGKAGLYLRVQVVMVILQLGLTIGAALLGLGLNGIAWGVTITQIINMLSLTGIVIFLMKSERAMHKDI